jgi:hypothetical protein
MKGKRITGRTEVECVRCHVNFLKPNAEIRRDPQERHFCSRNCYFLDKKERAKTKICSNCQKEYHHSRKTYQNSFCSKSCQLQATLKRNDFTGKKFGRCIVKELDKENTHKCKYWLLQCACKEIFSVRHAELRRGNVYECPNCVFRRSQYYIGGKKFGRLSVQDKWEWIVSPTNGKRFRHWWCVCECGNELWVCAHSILSSHTVSCGCYIQKNNSRYVNETLYPIRHGLSGKKQDEIYMRWIMLVAKCYNSKSQSYHNFGAQGFTVCDNWRNNYLTFHEWMISQKFHPGLTIDIKDGTTEFSPTNCFLCPISELANRMRAKTKVRKTGITYENETHTLRQWSEKLGIGFMTLKKRWNSCQNMKQCIEGKWEDGSGCHLRRNDISDNEIKRMYENGMTIKEIENALGTSAIKYRLKKMDITMRAASKRNVKIRINNNEHKNA